MVKVIDISEFQAAANNYHNKRLEAKKKLGGEDPLDVRVVNHVGMYSTVVGSIILFIGYLLSYNYHDNVNSNMVLIIISFVGVKYFVGGFGGSSIGLTSIKLLLSLYAIWLYFTILSSKKFICVDALNSEFTGVTPWFVMIFLLASGILLGVTILTYVKPKVQDEAEAGGYLYNRFTAGLSAGIGLAFCTLYLGLATLSSPPYSSSYSNNNVEEAESNIYHAIGESVPSDHLDPLTEAGNTAVKDLYRIFYSAELLGKNEYGDSYYSDALKAKFKELGITKGIAEPYSKAFRKEFDKVSDMEQLTESLILDCDPLWNTQGDIGNVNLEVTKVVPIDESHVRIYAKYNNYHLMDRDFYMVKENGIFKIDDMDGTRAYFKEEIESSKKYLEELKRQESQSPQNIDDLSQPQQSIDQESESSRDIEEQ